MKCSKCLNDWPERYGPDCPRCDTPLESKSPLEPATCSPIPGAVWHGEYLKASDRAIRMERERDEARREAIRWQDAWIPGDKPDTVLGSSTLMWVTMRHKESGKLSVGVLTYHNGHVMPCSDQCEPPECAIPHNPEEDGYCEEYEWTCWSDGYCEHCETEWVWSSHYTEIIAHAPVKKPVPFMHTTP